MQKFYQIVPDPNNLTEKIVRFYSDGQKTAFISEIPLNLDNFPTGIPMDYQNIDNPNWNQLRDGLFYSLTFQEVREKQLTIDSDAYATLIGIFTNPNAAQDTLLLILQWCGINFTSENKAEVNQILADNGFSIQM